ncbi:hypothetical protein ACFQ3Z_26970 [Streptomyces nogalater]
MHYRATNDASDTLLTGRHSYDLAWLSSDRYLRLRAKHAPAGATPATGMQSASIMRSPVVVGLTPDAARTLRAQAPGGRLSWADLADAAATGTVRFGMADPGAATAASPPWSASPPPPPAPAAPCAPPTSAATGCAASAPARASPPRLPRPAGRLRRPPRPHQRPDHLRVRTARPERLRPAPRTLEIVHPADGMVLADYPLLLLDPGRRAAYDRVVDWLTAPGHQRDIMRRTLRRPVSTEVPRDTRLTAPWTTPCTTRTTRPSWTASSPTTATRPAGAPTR